MYLVPPMIKDTMDYLEQRQVYAWIRFLVNMTYELKGLVIIRKYDNNNVVYLTGLVGIVHLTISRNNNVHIYEMTIPTKNGGQYALCRNTDRRYADRWNSTICYIGDETFGYLLFRTFYYRRSAYLQ